MDGTALIFCEGAFGRPSGKTANGLVRFGRRYDVRGVVDSTHAGRDASDVIGGVGRRVPIFASLNQAVSAIDQRPDYLVIGLSPRDGRLPPQFRKVVRDALRMGINVDSPLRPYLQDDAEFPGLAQQSSVRIRSVGYPKPIANLRSYTGEIASVDAKRIAVVGTHSLTGKRTTTVRLAETLRERRIATEMIGTGETSWLQGVRSTVILDSIVRKYVAGELEGIIVDAYKTYGPEVFVLEGQGSLLSRSNPSGYELLTTARPDVVVMQHALAHSSYLTSDAFGAETLERHIRIAEALAGSPVVAITVNPEGCSPDECRLAADALRDRFGLLVTDVLVDGSDALADTVIDALQLAVAAP